MKRANLEVRAKVVFFSLAQISEISRKPLIPITTEKYILPNEMYRYLLNCSNWNILDQFW
jgi:hypothetical protein